MSRVPWNPHCPRQRPTAGQILEILRGERPMAPSAPCEVIEDAAVVEVAPANPAEQWDVEPEPEPVIASSHPDLPALRERADRVAAAAGEADRERWALEARMLVDRTGEDDAATLRRLLAMLEVVRAEQDRSGRPTDPATAPIRALVRQRAHECWLREAGEAAA